MVWNLACSSSYRLSTRAETSSLVVAGNSSGLGFRVRTPQAKPSGSTKLATARAGRQDYVREWATYNRAQSIGFREAWQAYHGEEEQWEKQLNETTQQIRVGPLQRPKDPTRSIWTLSRPSLGTKKNKHKLLRGWDTADDIIPALPIIRNIRIIPLV